MRPSRRRRPSFTLIELIVVIAVLLLLIAIVLPSFLGVRGNAEDRAVQSNITIAHHNAKASWALHGEYPATGVLVGQLGSAEPAITFVPGIPVLPTDQIQVERNDAQTLTLCGLSASGRYYCLRSSERGGLTAAAAASRDVDFVAAAGLSISRSTGSDLESAKCHLADYQGEPPLDCDTLDGEGAPRWTSSIRASSAAPGGDTGGTDPPALAWVSTPADSVATTATFAYTASGGAAATTCALDGEQITPASSCASPIALSGLPYGSHTMTVRADNAGGDAELTHTWNVERPAPVVTILSQPTNSVATSGTVSYSVAGPDVTVTCELDGDALSACESPISVSGLPVGPHELAVTATNSGGTDTKTASWTVIAPAPVVTFTGGPAEAAEVTDSEATFAWTATHATSYTCKLDGATAASCSSPHTLSVSQGGSHTLTVTATGPGGTGAASRTWTYVKSYSQEVLSDSPQAYYRMGEGSGQASTLVDSSGNGRNLTGVGTVGATGAVAGDTARSFSGAQSQNNGGSPWAIRSAGQAMTVEAWIKPNWSPGDGQRIILANSSVNGALGASSQDMRNWVLVQNAQGAISLVSRFATVSSTFVPVSGEWAHVAATVGADGVARIYVDGIQVASGAFSYGPADGSGFFNFGSGVLAAGGAHPDGPPFKGAIDEVAFYSTALSLSRIQARTALAPQTPRVFFTQAPSSGGQATFTAKWSATAYATGQTCVLNGQHWADCDGDTTFSGLPFGSHTFTVTATGAAGSSSVSTSWNADDPSLVAHLELNGTSAYASIPQTAALKPADALYVDAWVRMDALPASGTATVASTWDTATNTGWGIDVYPNGAVRFYVTAGGALLEAGGPHANICAAETPGAGVTALSADGKWHHIRAVRGSSERSRIYLNGKVVGCSGIQNGGPNYTSQPINVGRIPSSAGSLGDIDVDSLRIASAHIAFPAESTFGAGITTAPANLSGGLGVWNFNSSSADFTLHGGATIQNH